MNTVFPFDRKKAAESASEFIRLAGGRINVLKLTKLMYLLDRASIEKVGVPVVGGRYVSMKDGPVTSQVLDAINHKNGAEAGAWNELIQERENYDVCARTSAPSQHLSPFEISLIENLHKEHQNKDQFALRNWCHDNCREWVKPALWQRGSIPIAVETLATEIKRSRTELEEAVNEAQFMAKAFSAA